MINITVLRKVIFIICNVLSISLFAQNNITYRSNLDYTGTLANLWGYYDTLNQKEYALVGVEYGLSIVDVTNPDSPKEIFFINGDTSLWQEPKTWKQYVYMTNETGKLGLMIVDLTNLPTSANVVFWKGSPAYDYSKGRSHSCFIDEKGILYLNGSQNHGGALMFDLKPNPLAPTYLGMYNDHYVHDSYARGDTLWTSEILNGTISVVDVSDKTTPKVLQRFKTPYEYTHNCWLSKDGRFLYTTDERGYAPVAVYDVSDLSDYKLIDQYRHSSYDSLIPHNTYITDNGFLYTSYYRAGVTIVDAHRPENLIEVGHYDTSPFGNANGFEGCWGVYPFLPSGNIIASDRQEGLFVLSPQLKRASYLEGRVTNQDGYALPGVDVSFVGGNAVKRTNFSGDYKTGTANAGNYDVRVYDPANKCFTKIIPNVAVEEGKVTLLNIKLNCLTTDIADININQAFIYPTAFSGNTTVNMNGISNGILEVYNTTGMLLETHLPTIGETSFGENLPAGAYFARLKSASGEKVFKLLKTGR